MAVVGRWRQHPEHPACAVMSHGGQQGHGRAPARRAGGLARGHTALAGFRYHIGVICARSYPVIDHRAFTEPGPLAKAGAYLDVLFLISSAAAARWFYEPLSRAFQ